MLKELKYVKRAILKNRLHPELQHFYIGGGFIKGYNGVIGMCSPIALDIEACPNAIQFVKAVQACEDTTAIHMTKSGRLTIKSGTFKAFVDCVDTTLPNIDPEGESVTLKGAFLPVLKKLYPFMAKDASRPWARGVLFKGQSAFATNNICLVEQWMETVFPIVVNIPQEAIKELIQIGEEPERIQTSETSVTFHFADGKWLKTRVYEKSWPDLTTILNRETNQAAFPANFFNTVEKLLPFVEEHNTVYFKKDRITTCNESDSGASIDIANIIDGPVFNAKQLLKLKHVATSIDFHAYPAPCLFYGDNLRGAIIGQAQ